MKNRTYIFILVIFLILAIAVSACDNAYENEVHKISNQFFTQEMMAIMFDSDNFLGRTINYEGVFMSAFCDIVEGTFYYVAQFGDDCCGEDVVGFELYLDKFSEVTPFTWVEVTGVLEEHNIVGVGDVLRLNVISIVEVAEPRP